MCGMFPPPCKTNTCDMCCQSNPYPPSHTSQNFILKALKSPAILPLIKYILNEICFDRILLKKCSPVLSAVSLLYVALPQKKSFRNQPSVSYLEFASSILSVFGCRHPIPGLVHALIPSFFIWCFGVSLPKVSCPKVSCLHFPSFSLLHYYYFSFTFPMEEAVLYAVPIINVISKELNFPLLKILMFYKKTFRSFFSVYCWLWILPWFDAHSHPCISTQAKYFCMFVFLVRIKYISD